GIENAKGGTAQVAAGNFFDELRDIDMRGTRSSAGRVEAVQAAVCFNDRGLSGERRMQLREEVCNRWLLFEQLRHGNLPRTKNETIRTQERELRLHQIAVHLWPSVAIELPGIANLGDAIEVEIGGEHLV